MQRDLGGRCETVADLERAFSSAAGKRVSHWPGMCWGLRAFYQMAALAAFLAHPPEGGTAALPITLLPFSEWLAARRLSVGG